MIHLQTRPGSPLQKIVATMVGLALLGLGLMFSVVMIPIVALLALLGWSYFHWKTRGLRQAMAERMRDTSVIEGEATVVREERITRQLR